MYNKPTDVAYGGLDHNKIIDAQTIIDVEALKHLYNFINARYEAHLSKDVYCFPKPWTTNPIVQKYRFTNVRREQDKTTRWAIREIVVPKHTSMPGKMMQLMAFRMFNKIYTGEFFKIPLLSLYKQSGVDQAMAVLASNVASEGFFTGVFFTTGMRQGLERSYPHLPEPIRVFQTVVDSSSRLVRVAREAENPKQIINELMAIDGIGHFMAYQIFVDWTYIPDFKFSENEFVVAGPGCKSGLKLLYTDWAGLSSEELLFQLRDNINALFKLYVDPKWDPKELMSDIPVYDRKLNVMSLENCMCEFSKYMRAVKGEGRPKQVFNGGTK